MSWYSIYSSSSKLTKDERLFLNAYDEESFIKLIPYALLLSKPTKTSVKDAVKMVRHWVYTGEWKYEVTYYHT